MSRWIVLSLLVGSLVGSLVACSKSAAPQNETGKPAEPAGSMANTPEMGGAKGESATLGGAPGGGGMTAGAGAGDAANPQRLQPKEGTLAITVPPDAKAGSEVVATVVVTPGEGYHVNKEFPTKLTLAKVDGVTFAKDQLVAGGADSAKGDADTMEESKLAFSVKMTPSAGNHTVTGTFKFAVCDKDSCLPKKETISIQVAAK